MFRECATTIGKASAQHLGSLKVCVNHVSQANEPSSPGKLLTKYPGLCEGVGCLENTDVMLYIDKSVSSVASKHSRTLFHMNHRVARYIDHLEKEGVIEKVSGPTDPHPLCRDITNLSTHLGLYQYKRLNFVIYAAAEIFQHKIQTVILNIPGTTSISNDIENDQALDQSLQRPDRQFSEGRI